jgi:hypothetical protein
MKMADLSLRLGWTQGVEVSRCPHPIQQLPQKQLTRTQNDEQFDSESLAANVRALLTTHGQPL